MLCCLEFCPPPSVSRCQLHVHIQQPPEILLDCGLVSAPLSVLKLSINYGSLFKRGVLCSAAEPGLTESIDLKSRRLFFGDLRLSHLWRAEGHNLVLTSDAYYDQMFEDL